MGGFRRSEVVRAGSASPLLYGAGGYGGGGGSTYTGTDGLSQVPAAQFSPNGQSGTYVVQAGDTLYGIAADLGTTVDALVATNGIEDPNLLYVGETLRY